MLSHSRALLVAALLGGPCLAAPGAVPPTHSQIAAAVAALKSDPDLATEHKARRLHWKDSNPAKPAGAIPDWLAWIGELFGWVADTGRLLLWVAGLLLVSVLGVYFFRFLRLGTPRRIARREPAPTHVRDLDIRPESLPEDIGAAAFELWERGEKRPALSLLYRGLLSRLAHRHALPIRESSTEGDCMELAARQLDAGRATYVAGLVRTWQHAVYGGVEPATDEIRALCGEFQL